MRKIFILLTFFIYIHQSNGQICVGTPGSIQWEAWRGLFDDEFSELSALEFFPSRPDVTQTLYKSRSPLNYDNFYAARIRGFISVPVSDSVTFAVTGNERSQFFFSSDEDPSNVQLMASHPSGTGYEEYDKFPEQLSQTLFLEQGKFYYFEILHVDGSGGDRTHLWWKASFLSNSDWNIITSGYLSNIGCLNAACPDRGTPCDDGDAMTTNDEEDGHCNCTGHPITSNACIGDHMKLEKYRYDNISGSELNDLYEDPDYPAMPDHSEVMPLFGHKSQSSISNHGALVQGYLKVPVSGDYKFNITGDDQTILFISSDESPDNKQAHQALVSGYTSMTQHDKYIWQSTGDIYLESDKYYYIEINQKQGGGSGHFQAFWQTPYSTPGVWKRISSFYLFDYECDIACIAEGTPCDDGDPFTNNDEYDDNCDCVGTPCSGPDCDSPLANYVPYDKCAITDQLDNNANNNWLSCTVNDNPNPSRERSHWIHYDLGIRHELLTSQIWNYNVANETSKGFETVAIDYSEDGINWVTVDTFNWALASGESNYSGFEGPDFTGIFAQHILFTSLDDTLTCRGLGKVAFSAVKCPVAGTNCDDEDFSTVNDKYNDLCECIGQSLLENECEDQDLVLGDSLLYSDIHSAINSLTSVSQIDQSSYVGFVAGNSIELNVGFETNPNSNFVASIDTCSTTSFTDPLEDRTERTERTERTRNEKTENGAVKTLHLIHHDDPFIKTIVFNLEKSEQVKLQILDQNQKLLYQLIDHKYSNRGRYNKKITTKKMTSGHYIVQLITESKTEVVKFHVE